MSTSLTNSKMNPALAARIERSVTGRSAGGSVVTRRLIAVVRLAMIPLLIVGIWSFVADRKREKAELDRARAELLEAAQRHVAAVDDEDRSTVSRAEAWLSQLSAPTYAGDIVTEQVRAPAALAMVLGRPTLYVRGAMDGFASSEKVADTAASSPKDALLLCLVDPPKTRTEKAVLERVRTAYFDETAIEALTPSIRPLHEAIAGLAFVMPSWSDRVRAAETIADLQRIRAELDHAPTERTKFALKARLMLAVIDEPGDGKGPTELDGERAHFIRIGLVELASDKILLSLRRRVDPSWISEERRATYAKGLDACAFAFDAREALTK